MSRNILIIMFTIIAFSACREENPKSGDQLLIDGENVGLHTNTDLLNDALSKRSDDFSDEFNIVYAEVIEGQLKVALSYSGDCETNKFDVIWSGALMESYPYQARLAVKRTTTNCTPTSDTRMEDFTIDLVSLIGDIVLEEPIYFHLVNTSSTDDETDFTTKNFE